MDGGFSFNGDGKDVVLEGKLKAYAQTLRGIVVIKNG